MDNLSLYGISGPTRLWAYAVLGLPLLSFLLNGLWLGRKHSGASGWVATGLMGLSFAAAIALALGWRSEVLERPSLFPQAAALAFEHVWMPFPGPALAAKFSFYLDPISVMMILIVTGISFLVHLYSIGTMREDRGRGRFFALLSFFTFTMLGLVSAHNIVQTFFFWELVGAASYLLIGFWYEKPAAVAAGKKAFVITRLADAFFLAGLLLVGLHAQSFDISNLNAASTADALNHSVVVGGISFNLLFAACLCLFAGAWGKSAMFPLHVWLPDAMEGPTPVSALIHSATMVVAGVYLTARFFPLFSACESMLRVVEATGLITALFAAVVACAQTDLKRILAFSTLSQLGTMMFALGLGSGEAGALGYSASMFHVFTHAFFKCLLFLSAGVIIHAVHGQDLKDMGGLRGRLPWTYALTLIACLAIAGVWPFAGFFSKDEILLATLVNGRPFAFTAALLTGGITAFYMFRYFFLVFHGSRKDDSQSDDVHGESAIMVIPMVVLAIPSVLAGLAKGVFLSTVRPFPALAEAEPGVSSGFGWVPFAALGMAAFGIAASYVLYVRKRTAPGESPSSPVWHRIVARKFYLDEAWMFLARRVAIGGVSRPLAWAEKKIVNGLFDLTTFFIRAISVLLSWAQNGRLQFYSGLSLVGLCLLYLLERGSP